MEQNSIFSQQDDSAARAVRNCAITKKLQDQKQNEIRNQLRIATEHDYDALSSREQHQAEGMEHTETDYWKLIKVFC